MVIAQALMHNSHRIDSINYLQGSGGDFLITTISELSDEYIDVFLKDPRQNNKYNTYNRKKEYEWTNVLRYLNWLEVDSGIDSGGERDWNSWQDVEDTLISDFDITIKNDNVTNWCEKETGKLIFGSHPPHKHMSELFPNSIKICITVDYGDTYWDKYIHGITLIKNQLNKIISEDFNLPNSHTNIPLKEFMDRCLKAKWRMDDQKNLDPFMTYICQLVEERGFIYKASMTTMLQDYKTYGLRCFFSEEKYCSLENVIKLYNKQQYIISDKGQFEGTHLTKVWNEKIEHRMDEFTKVIQLKDMIFTDVIADTFRIDRDIFKERVMDWHNTNLKVLDEHGFKME